MADILLDEAIYGNAISTLENKRDEFDGKLSALISKYESTLDDVYWKQANRSGFETLTDELVDMLNNYSVNMSFMVNVLKQVKLNIETADTAGT